MVVPKLALALAFAATLAPAAAADTLILTDGRIFDDVDLTREGDVVKLEFENGTITVSMDQVLHCIIPGDLGFEPTTDEEREKVAEGYVYYEDRWVRASARERALEKLLEEQREKVREIKSNRLWRNRRFETTRHFDFEYTVPQHVFERYRDLMEAYYEEFEDTFKIRPPRGHEPLKVCFYVDHDAFVRVTGVPRGVLGFFKFVRPYELAIFYDRLDPIRTEQVIYHEVGHYLQKLIDVDFDYPHWPGEAISEYYGASRFDEESGELYTGLVLESRLSLVQLDIKEGERVGLKDMLMKAGQRTFRDYTWGWSFVHFLMSDRKYRKRFPDFILALARDRNVDRYVYSIARDTLKTVKGEEVYRVFCDEMRLRDEDDVEELQERWYDYLDNELVVASTRGLMESARHAWRDNRNYRAKRLFEEAEAHGDMAAIGYHYFAQTLEELDEDEEAQEKWRLAIALDPLVADYYIDLGKSLLQERDEEKKEEGRRLLKLAFEIEPDNFYLERNLDRLLKD